MIEPTKLLISNYLSAAYKTALHQGLVESKESFIQRVFIPYLPRINDIEMTGKLVIEFLGLLDTYRKTPIIPHHQLTKALLLSSASPVIQSARLMLIAGKADETLIDWFEPCFAHDEEYPGLTVEEANIMLYFKNGDWELHLTFDNSNAFINGIQDFYHTA